MAAAPPALPQPTEKEAEVMRERDRRGKRAPKNANGEHYDYEHPQQAQKGSNSQNIG